MRRLFQAAAALAVLAAAPAFAAPDVRLAAQLVTDELELPVSALSPPGDPRLFVLEQTGRIRIVTDGVVGETPFLDLSAEVSGGNEQGLLGLAFHPDYASNGRFFINYTDGDGTTRIVAYTVSADPMVADPGSATTLLSIEQPYSNHNGGWVDFGPDGYLYIGMGDGGSGGDPDGRGQNPDDRLGKILRLDVDGAAPYAIPATNPFANGGGAAEVFILGARNPWRSTFDAENLIIADVGQGAWEEVNVLPLATAAGSNLGWNTMEGPACFNVDTCDRTGLTEPAHAYSHADGGCSITGGHVYRGSAIPELDGEYFFADFCAGFVRSYAYADGASGEVTDWTEQLATGAITSFGKDAAGELYFTTIEGSLFRIVRAE